MLPEPFSFLPEHTIERSSVLGGEVLFRQSDLVTCLYVLISGEVRLLRFGTDGIEIVIHRAFAGESFGEASLFSDNYHCDAVAVEPSELVRFRKAEVLQHFHANPEFALSLTAHLAKQVQSYRRLLELRAVKGSEQRVYEGVCEGRLKGNIKVFASQIGLTHETTYRTLSVLVSKKRLLKVARGSYCLPNAHNAPKQII